MQVHMVCNKLYRINNHKIIYHKTLTECNNYLLQLIGMGQSTIIENLNPIFVFFLILNLFFTKT